MNLLAIDTSSDASVLGLAVGDDVLEGQFPPQGNGKGQGKSKGPAHSRLLLPALEALLADAGLKLADLHGLVLGKGPGSFTGIRIGVALAQGLAYGLHLPVAPVSSLACRAQRLGAADGACIAVALKARLSEIYYGVYRMEAGLARACQDERLTEASQAPPASPGAWLGLGDGWEFRDQLERALGVQMARVQTESRMTAGSLLALGRQAYKEGKAVPALQALPEYLREEVASKPKQPPCPDSP